MNGAALIILDGWGLAPAGPGNCIRLAQTPVVDRLSETRPYTELAASGRAVGLPDGQMGNSMIDDLSGIREALAAGRFERFVIVSVSPDAFNNCSPASPKARAKVKPKRTILPTMLPTRSCAVANASGPAATAMSQ